ncbi:MAG TPA: hypothetical protein VK596_08760 [Edaphobacter sp.]|nr:hypothetical protein [Edaphobacter sp.]
MNKGLFFSLILLFPIVSGVFTGHAAVAQTQPQTAPAPKAKTSAKAKAAPPGSAAWTPDVQRYLGVQEDSFRLVGLNRLSKAQLDALVSAAKNNISGDPRRHILTCGPATAAQPGTTRVLVTVAGDDPTGQRATEILQAIKALNGVQIVDTPAAADRALHVVIQEQTLGKRTIGYTASYVTATPCADESRKTDAELKGQLGTYTDPRGVDLANDLSRMFGQDLQAARSPAR